MQTDDLPNFSLFLNTQSSIGNGVNILQGTAGEVLFKVNMSGLIPDNKKASLYKININFYSKQVDHSVLDSINSTFYLEIVTGTQIFNMYGLRNNNAITVPLERTNLLYNGTNSTDIYSAKNCFTSMFPSDQIIFRIKSCANDAIATAFPHYTCNLVFEPIFA